jgi:hypothetical protein
MAFAYGYPVFFCFEMLGENFAKLFIRFAVLGRASQAYFKTTGFFTDAYFA